MDLHTLISTTRPFSNFRGVGCYISPHFLRIFYKQTVKIIIRHRIMQCLISICTVCLCPIKRTLCLDGLIKGRERIASSNYIVGPMFELKTPLINNCSTILMHFPKIFQLITIVFPTGCLLLNMDAYKDRVPILKDS